MRLQNQWGLLRGAHDRVQGDAAWSLIVPTSITQNPFFREWDEARSKSLTMPQMFSVQRSKPIVSRRSPEICHWQPQRWNNRVKKPSRDSKLDSNQPICLWTISAIAFLHWAYNGVAENHVCLQTCTLSTLENRPWNFEPSLFRFKEVKHWSIMFWKKLKKKRQTQNVKTTDQRLSAALLLLELPTLILLPHSGLEDMQKWTFQN